MNQKRIVIAGGSGFIGTALANEFAAHGWPVVVLTRSPRQRTGGITELGWDGEQLGEWIQALDGAAAEENPVEVEDFALLGDDGAAMT